MPNPNPIGQQTGKTDITSTANTAEALKLLKMIGSVAWMENLPDQFVLFLTDMMEKANQYGTRLHVSGRQLFRLRDAKDLLIEKGLL